LEQASDGLVVFAPKIYEEVLATMLTNKLRGVALCLALEVGRTEELSAIAHLTRARLIDQANSGRLLGPSVGGFLGKAREVIAEVYKTTVIG